MEILENGRHTQEEMTAGLADDALVEAAVVEAHTGETMAMVDAPHIALTGCTVVAVNAQQATLTQSTALALVANEDARLTDGGGFAQVAGRDFTLTNGGAAVMGAGRDLTVTNGGAGILLAGRDVTVHAADDGRQYTALAAGAHVTVQNGTVGVVLATNPHIDNARVLIDITPQRIVDAAMTLAVLPLVLFDMVRGRRDQEGETAPESE